MQRDLPELFEFWQRGRKTHCASGRAREIEREECGRERDKCESCAEAAAMGRMAQSNNILCTCVCLSVCVWFKCPAHKTVGESTLFVSINLYGVCEGYKMNTIKYINSNLSFFLIRKIKFASVTQKCLL